jgi:hypothetical protein
MVIRGAVYYKQCQASAAKEKEFVFGQVMNSSGSHNLKQLYTQNPWEYARRVPSFRIDQTLVHIWYSQDCSAALWICFWISLYAI